MEALSGRSARRGFTFEAYVPALIADQGFALESDLAAAAANAEAACRELNEESPGLSNFETVARRLLRAESVASSRSRDSSPIDASPRPPFSGTHDITGPGASRRVRTKSAFRGLDTEPPIQFCSVAVEEWMDRLELGVGDPRLG